jgi:hypothetical protein
VDELGAALDIPIGFSLKLAGYVEKIVHVLVVAKTIEILA